MLIYYLLLILFIVIALLDTRLTLKSKYILLIVSGIIMIFFAGLRGPHVDKDYDVYLKVFKNLPTINLLFTNSTAFFLAFSIEPTFIIIGSLLKNLFSNGYIFLILVYAFLGVFLKLRAIVKMTDLVLLSSLIYFSRIFLLQDMIQIRAGVAAGFILLSIPSMEEKNFKKFLMYFLLAFAFHYSAIIILPFFFLNSKKIDKLLYLLVIIVPIFLCLIKFDPLPILAKLDFGIITDRINTYILRQKEVKDEMILFGIGRIVQILLTIFFVLFSEKSGNKYAIILTKINCYGVACFYLFTFSPAIALRLSELLCCVQIILIPLMYYIIKPKFLAELLVILSSIIYFINITGLFEAYKTVL